MVTTLLTLHQILFYIFSFARLTMCGVSVYECKTKKHDERTENRNHESVKHCIPPGTSFGVAVQSRKVTRVREYNQNVRKSTVDTPHFPPDMATSSH